MKKNQDNTAHPPTGWISIEETMGKIERDKPKSAIGRFIKYELSYYIGKWFWRDLFHKLKRRFLKRYNRAHMYTDLPSDSWNCFETVAPLAISRWFLMDWPNYLALDEKTEKGFNAAKKWFDEEKPILQKKLDTFWDNEYDDAVFINYKDQKLVKQRKKRILEWTKIEKEIYRRDTEHLCFIIKHRDKVTD